MKRIYLNIVFFSLLQNCFAQQLTLQDAVNIALKNSFDIQIAKNNEKISQVNNNIGIAGGLPIVTSTSTDIEQLNDINQKNTPPVANSKRNDVATNLLNSNVTGSILLYNGMRVIATKHQLEVLEKLNQQKLNSSIQDLISTVMLKYYDVIRQQSYLKTLSQSIEVSQKKLDIINLSKQVGMANDADVLQAQLDLNSQLQASQSQDLVISQDKADLLTYLSLNADSTIEIKDTILIDDKIILGDVLSQLNINADIQASDLQIKANQWIEKETTAQRYPSVKLNGGYNFNISQYQAGTNLYNQNNGPFIGLSIGIPIYNGSVYKREEQVARINTQNSVLQKDALLRDYSDDAVKTWQAYNNSLQQLQREIENNKLAAQLLDLVIKKFQLKQATIIDVKEAQQTFENSGYLLVNLSYSAKAAEIELKRLLNKLSL